MIVLKRLRFLHDFIFFQLEKTRSITLRRLMHPKMMINRIRRQKRRLRTERERRKEKREMGRVKEKGRKEEKGRVKKGKRRRRNKWR